jgi:hypothetical protein
MARPKHYRQHPNWLGSSYASIVSFDKPKLEMMI